MLLESQCGLRAGRLTTDMIFTLRKLQEKTTEQQYALYVVFVDFSKPFDNVDRETLWKVLELYGCLENMVKIIKGFHDGITGRVSIGRGMIDAFTVNHGVKQGCLLKYSQSRHTLPLAAVLEIMGTNLSKGFYIRTRSDGKTQGFHEENCV